MVTWIFIGLAVALLAYLAVFYNKLIKERTNVAMCWSEVDVQLQKRFDLIPNLVEVAKGYMKHEDETLTKVIGLRTAWEKISDPDTKVKIGSDLASTVNRFIAVAEAYPDLKASENMLELQKTIAETEGVLAQARSIYNDAVAKYNNKVKTFPTNIIAGMFQFKEAEFFNVQEQAKENVNVNF